jgi:Na+-transporting methylmalonyl-CoA/oxaloacetate decarboxylase gamma subunit
MINRNEKKAGIACTGLLLTLLLLLLLTLSACSSKSVSENQYSGGAGAKDYAPMAPEPSSPSMAVYGEAEYYAPEPDMYVDDAGFVTTSSSVVQSGRKITFSASMSINTKNFDADYAKINGLIAQYGGYVSFEEMSDFTSYGRNQGRYSMMTALVPADGYNSFLADIITVGDVTNKNKWSQDLTAQYFDTAARIEMLELRKERLMGYLVEAEDAADIVEFERELSSVLYELDMYQGEKRHLDRLVEYSTVDVRLTELITPETIGKDGEPLGDRASTAFRFSVDGVGRFLEGVVVFFAGAAPVLALLAVIAAIVLLIVRLTRPLREKARIAREAREEKRAIKAAQYRAGRRQPAYAQPQAYGQQQAYQQPSQYMQQQYMQTPPPTLEPAPEFGPEKQEAAEPAPAPKTNKAETAQENVKSETTQGVKTEKAQEGEEK